jgi:hypothetical protein
MKKPIAFVGAALGSGIACLALFGCPNPNNIGVQTFGAVQVTCVQASNNQPVSGALVQVDGATGTTNSSGIAVVSVAIGSNIPASCDAPGLSGSTTIPTVAATNTTSAPLTITIQMTPS